MRELTDATSHLGNPAALLTRLSQDGYLFFRGLLPAEAVWQVRQGVTDALRQAGWLQDKATVERPVPTGAAVREGGPGYYDAYTGIQRLQAFHELAHAPELLRLMTQVIGEPLLAHPRKVARTSLPQDDEYTRPHQDFRLIQGTVDVLTAWLPLGDCPRSLGALRVLSGSHAGGLWQAASSTGPGGLTVDVADDDPAWRTTDFRAGDVLVFSSLTVHAALRNDEDSLRFSADFRYQSLLEPVVQASLAPHFWPQVPDWDELITGWTDCRSVEAPAGARIAELRHPLDAGLVPPASRLLTAG